MVSKWDPSGTLLWSAEIGGGSIDSMTGRDGLTVSPDGFVHVVGFANSIDFPLVNPQDSCPPALSSANPDAFAFKLDQTASALVYSTCLGGPLLDWAQGSALDSQGTLYVTGKTGSKEYPVMNNATLGLDGACLGHSGNPDLAEGHDMFLTKLDSAGTMQYSTCWGGLSADDGRAVDVDAAGNAYVVGNTDSASFPQKNNQALQTGMGADAQAGFVVRFTPQGTVKFSTYVGGGLQNVVLHNGKLYVSGGTGASDFATKWPDAITGAYQPSYAGGFDAFVARLRFKTAAPHRPVMDRITYLGGTARDYPWGMAVSAGAVWMVVDGESTDFPEVGPLQTCAQGNNHVARLNKALTTLTFSTCLGGASGSTNPTAEQADGVAVDAAGNAYVGGNTLLPDHPTTVGAFDTTCGTDGACTAGTRHDAYLAKYTP